jgi:carboxyl-terminal processing protease
MSGSIHMKNNRSWRSISLWRTGIFGITLCCLLLTAPFRSAYAQLGPFDRDSAQSMLEAVKDDLKNNYYDSSWRGMNLDSRFKEAEGRIKQAQTRDQLIIIIAQILLDLNDSHTFFLPPFRAARVRYGWRMQMVGDTCRITDVNPKSDAAAKGLKAGDTLLAVDGHRPTRDNLWKMNYRYYALMPARSIRLSVISPDEKQPREIEVLSKIEKTAETAEYFTNIWRYNSEMRLEDDRFYELGDLLVWRMPGFDISPERVDRSMTRVRKFKTLVLDLRGNGGGYNVTLEHFAGYFFDHDVKIADLKGRKQLKPIVAKTHGDKIFKGQLIIIVDSTTGSAAELFARIAQLEKRGTVIGDHTAGAVMTSKGYDHQIGVGGTLYYGTSITIADVFMPDSRSLEKVGVIPDEVILPSASDIAGRRDPVLTRGVSIAGGQISPEKAGTLFLDEWLK